MRSGLNAVVAALSLTSVIASHAQPPPLGVPFQVNVRTTGSQYRPVVAQADNGSFVVVWSSPGALLGQHSILIQRFSASGFRRGGVIQANAGAGRYPAVAMDDGGDFVVVWATYHSDSHTTEISGRRFRDNGQAVGGGVFQVNSLPVGLFQRLAVAVADDGEFVVAWHGEGNIVARRFDSAGNPDATEFQVNNYTLADQEYPSLAMDGAGNFVVVWQDPIQDDGQFGVFGRRFDEDGAALSSEFQVSAFTEGFQWKPSVAMHDAGFVVAWSRFGPEQFDLDLFARRFDSAGLPLDTDFRVNTNSTGYVQWFPSAAIDDQGDFLITWLSSGLNGAPSRGVFARRFGSTGQAQGLEFKVNSYSSQDQSDPEAAMSSGGSAVIVWAESEQDGDQSGVFARRYGDVIALDVDGDGSIGPLTDGLLVLRYGFGFRGAALIAAAIDSDACSRCEADDIETFIGDLVPMLDIDGDGAFAPLTDGLLFLRYAFGIRGTALVVGAVSGDCARCTATEIEAFLEGLTH